MVSLELGKETMRKIFRLFTSVEQETFLSPHQDSESLWELRIFSLSNARHETKKLSFNISLMEHLLKRVKAFHYRSENCYRNRKSISSRIYSR